MNRLKHLLIVLLLVSPIMLKSQDDHCRDFSFDHLIFFVSDSSVEQQLSQFLTLGEKLTTQHYHQGTKSQFYLFYNTFIELIYVDNTSRIENNEQAFGSDYSKRWEKETGLGQLGVGLILSTFDTTCSNLHAYYSKDNKGYYLMSKANTNLEDAMVYVSENKHAYKPIENIKDLEKHYQQPYLDDFIAYNQHSSSIQTLTSITIKTKQYDERNNLKLLSEFDFISVEEGQAFRCILEFDHFKQKQTQLVSNWLEIRY